MKKSSIFSWFTLIGISVLTINISCSPHNKNRSDLEESNIHGKVKSIKTSIYEVQDKFGEITKDDIEEVNVFEYNEDGFWTTIEIYESNGNIKGRDIRRFDENGNEFEYLRYDSDGKLKLKFDYTLDQNGNQIKLDWYEYNKLHSKSEYEFDENGNEIERNQYDPNGKFMFGDKNKYDSNGNKIEEISINSEGVISIDRWKYSNDKMIESNHYDKDGKLSIKNAYNYDNNGNLIERNLYNEDGSLSQKWNYKYDEYGNSTEYFHLVLSSNEEEREKYEYEYGENKNWIKGLVIKNGKPHRIVEREIIYY